MRPTEKEKEDREYELGLARAALRKLNCMKKTEDTRKFESLKWADEVTIISKRRKIEDNKAKELRKRKANAIENINKRHEDESEVDESDDEQDIQASLLSKRPVVTDLQTPNRVLRQTVGKLFSHFRVSIFIHILYEI